MTRNLIVSTCGASLLINDASKEMRALLSRTANTKGDQLESDERDQILGRLSQRSDELNSADSRQVRILSAELNGILGFYEGRVPASSQDQHVLLHTDTFLGEKVAEALREWLTSRKLNATRQCAEGLTTKTVHDFRVGISSVITWCEQTLPGYRDSGFRVVLNLSGGFKSLQGFMQTLGMFYAAELVYIFENNDELLRIPRLPVELERSVEEAVQRHIEVFRRLSPPGSTMPREDCDGIPETLVYELDGEVELSPWGNSSGKEYDGVSMVRESGRHGLH